MRNLDGKYAVQDEAIVNKVSGETIPEDEPLFLLRGRDRLAIQTIRAYLMECLQDRCTDLHIEGVRRALTDFMRFAAKYPDRMKQPGITQHLKLEKE